MKITQRLQLLKSVILIGILASVLLSYNLWAGQRYFPKAPLFSQLPTFIGYFDYINLCVLIVLLIIAILNQKKIWLFLIIIWSVYLCIDDQNRLQPWFFNYILILFILLFFKNRLDESNNYHSVFISLQVLVALVYVFSGLQKMNSNFVNDTFNWLTEPLNGFLSLRQQHIVLRFGALVPFIEFALGLGLLVKPIRFIVLPLLIMMHIIILMLLGPFGKSYNYVVWPWNLVMILLLLILFTNVKSERFFDITVLLKKPYFYIVLICMAILPIFSFDNRYDSYLSSSLYSGNTNNVSIALNPKTYIKLPHYIKHFCYQKDSVYELNFKLWAITELGAPCIPEERIFVNGYNYITKVTDANSNDIKYEFIERERILGFKK